MAGKKSSSRKTGKTVRMPATKFAHLQKQFKRGLAEAKKLKTKKTK